MTNTITLDDVKKMSLEQIAEIYKQLNDENKKTYAMFGLCMVIAQDSVKAVG